MCSVPIPQGRDRHSCVLVPFWDYLPLWVHFGFARFFYGDPDGLPEYGERGWGLAARSLCLFAWSYWS